MHPPAPRTRPVLVVAGLLLAIGGFVAVGVLAAPRAPAPAATAAGTITPSAPATSGPPPSIAPKTATTVITTYLTRLAELTTVTDAATLRSVAAGAALDEAEAQLMEIEANGWTVRGAPRVVEAEVLGTRVLEDGVVTDVAVCLDSSTVEVLQEGGRPVAENRDAAQRALNLYSLREIDGAWRVVGHSFPSDPTC